MDKKFQRTIIAYKNYFLDFFHGQNEKVQEKISWTIDLVKTLEFIPNKYFEHLSSTTGIFEIRIEVGSNIYRIFTCFDQGNLVILMNGFQKKTQKTPKKEIEKAERIKAEYFSEKLKELESKKK